MMSVDNLIHQLIHSGLADTFLNVINNHYLKVMILFDIISDSGVGDVDILKASIGLNDTLVVTFKPGVDICDYFSDDEFEVQINKCGNESTVCISNKLESEGEVYETRFSRHAKDNWYKWS